MDDRNKKIIEIQDALLRKGMTLAMFARSNGWAETTVRGVVSRHCCGELRVRGVITRAILDKLHETVNTGSGR
jgi:lambda repressor-like predicted transcriptional regulator